MAFIYLEENQIAESAEITIEIEATIFIVKGLKYRIFWNSVMRCSICV